MQLRAALLALVLALCACPEGQPVIPPPTPEQMLKQRPYGLTTPPNWDGGSPLPLVLVLHGHGGTPEATDAFLGMSDLAQVRPLLVARPVGTGQEGGGFVWNFAKKQPGADDVAYLRAVIADIRKKRPVAEGQVYLVGHSEGAHMAHRFACDAADATSAFAALAGQVPTDPAQCQPSRAVPALIVHGDLDDTIPYAGGPLEGQFHNPPSAHDSAAVWARNDGCAGPMQDLDGGLDLASEIDGGETTREAYAGCPEGIGVELWTIHGGDHRPPLNDPGAAGAIVDWLEARGPR